MRNDRERLDGFKLTQFIWLFHLLGVIALIILLQIINALEIK